MSTDDDWRRDPARGPQGTAFARYRAPRPGWNHDNRAACADKVSEALEGTPREGWTSVAEAGRPGGRRRVCDSCFRDLAGPLGWRDRTADGDTSEWEAT